MDVIDSFCMISMYPNRKQNASAFVSDLGAIQNRRIGNNPRMKNRIREYRKRAGLSMDVLAKRVNTTRATIKKLEDGPHNGGMHLTTTWMERLAPHLDCNLSELMGGEEAPRVPILGSIGAGEEVIPIDDLPLARMLGDVDYDQINCEYIEAPPGGIHRNMVALRVKGDSMEPYLSEGDVVYYNQIIRGGFNDYLGKRVIAALKDGRLFMKTLERSHNYGKFNLRSYNAKLIESIELDWCARVAFIKPA